MEAREKEEKCVRAYREGNGLFLREVGKMLLRMPSDPHYWVM